MTIYTLLKNDHIKVLDLVDDLLELPEDDDRATDLIRDIRDELVPHTRAEEAVFYNSLRSLDSARDVVVHSYREHVEAEALLRAVQLKAIADLGWKKMAVKLQESLHHHIQQEEGKIWAAAKQLFTPDESELMGEAFQRLKPEIKGEGIAATTLELAANLMPPRFAKYMRGFNLESRV